MLGMIFDIQHCSLHDGPGIRTTVFLKGCPMRCLWCHNPEGLSMHTDIFFDRQKCLNCGKCIRSCPDGAMPGALDTYPIEKKRCSLCGGCTTVCPSHALESVGLYVAPEELLGTLLEDLPFYRYSHGGVTFSGGEPLFQPIFLEECLTLLKREQVHTALETSLCADRKWIEEILPITDLWLVDVKAIDGEKHEKLTGVSNREILKNLHYLSGETKKIIVRVPVIPDANEDELDQIGQFLLENRIFAIQLLPYHPIGEMKYGRLDLPVPAFVQPSPQRIETHCAHLEKMGLTVLK